MNSLKQCHSQEGSGCSRGRVKTDTQGKFSAEEMALFVNPLTRSCVIGINFQNVTEFVLEELEVDVN